MPAHNVFNRRGGRRRKHPPVRFGGGGAPSPPHQEERHASPEPTPDQIPENPEAEMETDESGTDPEEFEEFVAVSLSDLRNNVQCPICLGIIKKTRTVMECLHRFCRECIDKSMRLGNNECPACRTHCASRRSLRDNVDFDKFICSVYPDLEKYEKEELILQDEEKAVNEQIQASIAKISLRQSEAVVKSRKVGREAGASTSRVPRGRKIYSRRNSQSIKCDDSSKNHEETDNATTHENQPELCQGTGGPSEEISPIQTPMAVVDEEEAEDSPNSTEPTTENARSSHSLLNLDYLTWGRAGVRSYTRYGGTSASKVTRSNRIKRLVDHLANVGKNDQEHVAPVITTHLENDQIIWLKDYKPSISEASTCMDVLNSPPKFNSLALPPV